MAKEGIAISCSGDVGERLNWQKDLLLIRGTKKIQFFSIRYVEHNDINFCSNSKVYLNLKIKQYILCHEKKLPHSYGLTIMLKKR